MLSEDILHTTWGLTPDRKASKRGGARDPPNGDVWAGAAIGYAIFIPSTLDGDQVISRRDVAILNAHVAARIWINSISVGRVMWSQYSQISDHHIAAINWMDVPKWRILENQIGDNSIRRVHQLEQMGSCEGQCTLLPHVPPHTTLPIDGAILTCNENILKSIAMDQTDVSLAGQLAPSPVWGQRVDQRPARCVLLKKRFHKDIQLFFTSTSPITGWARHR